jgi:hypothetical protein
MLYFMGASPASPGTGLYACIFFAGILYGKKGYRFNLLRRINNREILWSLRGIVDAQTPRRTYGAPNHSAAVPPFLYQR